MNSRKKILFIDDEQINLDFFDVMLSNLGFVVEKAVNGVDALEKLEYFFPDIIILDNIMPKMSGWELTKILKQDPKFREIPIIMLSALDDVKTKVEVFEMGVDDYITKPFNFSEVLARIRAVLRNQELFRQIKVRESRLILAEELGLDMKNNLTSFTKSLDELDVVINQVSSAGEEIDNDTLSQLLKAIKEKTDLVREAVVGLDTRIERTIAEWGSLKQYEIGIQTLEQQIRKSPHQETGWKTEDGDD
ncbi:MAG: response regulator [Spirochaetaceae bacterium]|jgi:DNA-binding response OmpR family regulator|nr:response regulator [Spirochaetaceae bacterium]